MKICCITSNPQIEYIKSDLEKLGKLSVYNKQKLNVNDVVALAKDSDILIAGSSGIASISKELIEKLPKLRFIALLTVGIDWVDVVFAKSKGIVVCNIKGANSESVAEHTWGMILDLAKRISEFDRDARFKGAYKFNDYKGKEVFGKTLGIIGLGDIGKKVARGAIGFNMKVLGLNKSKSAVQGVKLVELDEILIESDVIAVCAPLTRETKNMISRKEIAKMKDGVILVNTSREELVDKSAVIEGLDSGKIFGYGIETAMMTPIPPDDLYYSHSRVVVTPHNAFNTEEADRKSYELVVENIRAWIEGKPQNVVT
ncbi:MAG: NAD(P)-dependent oxidoreductase [Patescibacteria group bacterium]